METKLDQQDSLRIINEMIAEARNNFTIENARSMISMGYIVAAIAIFNILLIYTLSTPSYSFFIWLLMFPVSFISSYFSRKRKQIAGVSTHIEKIISSVWSAYGISMIVLLTIIFSFVWITGQWNYTSLITPVILTFTGLAQYITSVACRFQPYRIGAFVFWIGALLCILVIFTPYAVLQFVILAVCMLLGFVVPSHLLNKKSTKNV